MTFTAPGRNDPCWCGSGKKFKKCHLHRADSPRIPVSAGVEALREAKKGKECNSPAPMHDECSGGVIDSHTISKSLGLKKLSVNNHVLALKHDFSTLKKTKGVAEVGEMSINKMSVFPGFCSFHDKKLFSPIEDAPFSGTQKQCALLSYRALAREYHSKTSGTYINDFLKSADSGKSQKYQVAMQSFLRDYGTGLDLATSDLKRGMAIYHEAVLSENFESFESLIIELPEEFPLLCSLGHMPSEDWNGRLVQNLLDEKLEAEWVTAVSFQSENRAWVVFTWKKSSKIISDFVHSLVEKFRGREADALIKYFFSISENIAMRPSWWRSLKSDQKAALNARILDGIPINGGENVMPPKANEPIVCELPLINWRLVSE